MNQPFWTAIFAIGIVQGVLVGAALIARRKINLRASRYLILIIVVQTAMIVCEALERTIDPAAALKMAFVNINTDLTIGPLLFLFARSIAKPDRRFSWQDSLHFLPFLIGLLAWQFAWISIRDIPGGSLHSVSLLPYFVAIKALFFFVYVSATYQFLGAELRRPMQFATRKSLAAAVWLRRGLVGVGVAVGLIFTIALLDSLKIDTRIEPDLFGTFLLAAFIVLASLMLMLRPSLLLATRATQRYADSDGQTARLIYCIENNRKWLDPAFGLGNLARAMGVNENRVSALINRQLGTNFYSLLGSYRLTEFEHLVSNPDNDSKSVLELAYASGFGSKASFYRTFRERHRMTPTEYRKECFDNRATDSSQRSH